MKVGFVGLVDEAVVFVEEGVVGEEVDRVGGGSVYGVVVGRGEGVKLG